ncbi:hypothetical protein [Zhongshania sp.]|uniref:hypothetical protein n=1 Tax=Zhongshania sp. TaxID=1971902 RepID=UPI003566A86C
MIQEEYGFIYLADRPGNRRIDNFRNILEQPKISIFAIVSGCKDILALRGTAELCTGKHLLQRFKVQNKEPMLVTKINPNSLQIRSSMALTKSALWPPQIAPKDLIPSEIFKSHIQQSNARSIQAKIARAAVSLPGAMKKGLEIDYKKNMY